MSGRDFKRDTGLNNYIAQSVTEFQCAIANVVLEGKLADLFV